MKKIKDWLDADTEVITRCCMSEVDFCDETNSDGGMVKSVCNYNGNIWIVV